MAFLTIFVTVAWLVAAEGWVKVIAVVFPALWVPWVIRWKRHRLG
jgi:hypothetical protein